MRCTAAITPGRLYRDIKNITEWTTRVGCCEPTSCIYDIVVRLPSRQTTCTTIST